MEWKSLFIGLFIGALIAIPLGMAHSGGFDIPERTGSRWGFAPGMTGYGMMDENMHEEMEEEMEPIMEKYMGEDWKEMHEYCERAMGIDEDE
ncbi:hypothetical protein DRN44_04135 [Thermococci archaeon]|nr:MAG: hypothetical protein DRN44_04135 [Thermococci archaeon]